MLTFSGVLFWLFSELSSEFSELDKSIEIGLEGRTSTITTGSSESWVSRRGRGFDSRHFNWHRHMPSSSSGQLNELSQKLSSGHFVSSQNERHSASVIVWSVASRDAVTTSSPFSVACRQLSVVGAPKNTKHKNTTILVFMIFNQSQTITYNLTGHHLHYKLSQLSYLENQFSFITNRGISFSWRLSEQKQRRIAFRCLGLAEESNKLDFCLCSLV